MTAASPARECEARAIGEERSVRFTIEDRDYSHAPFDEDACLRVHCGCDPRFSPFWTGKEAPGELPRYHQFLHHRFRHLSICVGRGCLRSCLDHLEKAGRIEGRFRTPMIERERWTLPNTDPARQ